MGPRVADRLGWTFVDLDAEIERRAGRSIPALFEAEGEAAFRAAEADALRRTAAHAAVVVAVGGGALVQEENLRWALAHGTVVYLRAAPETLAQRLDQVTGDRPLLRGASGRRLTGAALRRHVEDLMAARAPLYEQAQVILDTSGRDVEETAKAVAAALRARRG